MNLWTGRAPNKHIAKVVQEYPRLKEFLIESPWRNKCLLEAYLFTLTGFADPAACMVSRKGNAAVTAYLKSSGHKEERFRLSAILDLSGSGYILMEDRHVFFIDHVVASRWCEFRIALSHVKEPVATTDGIILRRICL